MKTSEYISQVQNGKVNIVSETEMVLKEAEHEHAKYFPIPKISHALATSCAKEKKKGKLSGVFVSVKDCLCVKDVESTAGCRILEEYVPVFDATVVSRVKEEGGIIIGKTCQDEFGFGSFSVNVGKGVKVPLNPHDVSRVCGGSSGGSAGLVAALAGKAKHMSIAESTGGSIVCPASFCGVVGLCPSYGLVSRYGLMDYANSLDKIGPIAENVSDAALLLEVIAGYDAHDSTSLQRKAEPYTTFVGKDIKGMRIAVMKEGFGKGIHPEVSKKVKDCIELLKKKGAVVEEVSVPFSTKYALSTYYIIATSEASTNLAKYCGLRYGKMEKNMNRGFNEYFTAVRSEHFNDETKRRIILGTFTRMAGTRDAYYIRAMKVRTKIIEEYKQLFKKFDVMVCPTMPVIAPRFEEIKKLTPLENYMMDILTVGPNLAGLPHLTVPCGKVEGMPVGIMFIGDHLSEGKIIQVGSAVE